MSTEGPAPWRWVSDAVAFAVHDRQIAEHGGLDGVRDEGAILSALNRPLQIESYEDPDAARLAAAYACGIANNHGFLDGNKRTAWVVARLFLADNGEVLRFDRMDAVPLMEGVAAGRIRETELAEWFRAHLTPQVHDRRSAGALS